MTTSWYLKNVIINKFIYFLEILLTDCKIYIANILKIYEILNKNFGE
jgi:hypothetical protein